MDSCASQWPQYELKCKQLYPGFECNFCFPHYTDQDKAVYNSLHIYALGGKNPKKLLFSPLLLIISRTGFFLAFGKTTDIREGKTEFKPTNLLKY